LPVSRPAGRAQWPTGAADQRLPAAVSSRRCSAAGWSAPPVHDLPDTPEQTCRSAELGGNPPPGPASQKSLWIANGVAVLATLCSVPIPCCCRCWWTKCCWAMAMPR
jgi:hypothetical protein